MDALVFDDLDFVFVHKAWAGKRLGAVAVGPACGVRLRADLERRHMR
jgi:hypothetical protein